MNRFFHGIFGFAVGTSVFAISAVVMVACTVGPFVIGLLIFQFLTR